VAEAKAKSARQRTGRVNADTSGDTSTRPVCTVAFCPICMAVTATHGWSPDAVEHLLKAAREFFLAARAVIDARADDLERKDETSSRLERIDIE
jgi:hypothetical protein